MCKVSILSCSMSELQNVLKEMGEAPFRAKQIFQWLHQKQVSDFGQMSNLSLPLREKLKERFYIERYEIARKQVSSDGTIKYLFRLRDGNCIETVLMRYHHGNSVCVSTQVGCRMGCRFCASTKGGLVRSLSAGEILEQIYMAERDTGEPISSIVLMGIGEPLDNFENVVRFLQLISDSEGRALSQRSVSLSTCGIVPGIDRLAGYKFGLTLSISLHAPFQDMRSSMMPINDAYPIQEVMAACRRYQKATGRRISFEYTMVNGVNDSPACATALAKLLRGLVSHVNLIPINPVDGTGFSASDAANIRRFQEMLEKLGVTVTVRRRLGQDISAACGQLRAESAAEEAAR